MKRVVSIAVTAQRRLGDPATFNLHRPSVATHVALEERLAHLRNDSARPDHHPTHGDELVNVLRVQVPHAGHLLHAKRTHLQCTQNGPF